MKNQVATINVNTMSLTELLNLRSQIDAALQRAEDAAVWEIGAGYLIRTGTMTDTGRLVAVTPNELVLEDAAWIADTGRFYDALKNCEFSEVEPFPDGRVIIGRGALVDAVSIPVKSLPRKQI